MKFESKVRRILLKAAKLIEQGKADGFSCIAISIAAREMYAGSEARDEASEHFRAMFSPYRYGTGERRDYGLRGRRPFGSARFWDVETYDKPATVQAQLKRERIDALLAAAASYEPRPYASAEFV